MDNTGILDIINSISSNYKKIEVKELPTQGFFYKNDFLMEIRKASYEDIIEYNFNYFKDEDGYANIGIILYEIYKIVKRNTKFSNNYTFEDIKSNDILYIFFEIVKYTMDKDVLVPFDELFGVQTYAKFTNKTYNYFDYKTLGFDYNEETKEFLHSGYSVSMPSIGVQNCLVDYVYEKELAKENTKLNYDFLFFLGNKNYLSDDEIDNLITIFNYDLDDKEIRVIRDIVYKMASAVPNTLKMGNKIISVDTNVDFENLFL